MNTKPSGREVLLDEDLADLYGVETRVLGARLSEHDAQLRQIFYALRQLIAPPSQKRPVGFRIRKDDEWAEPAAEPFMSEPSGTSCYLVSR